MVAIFQNLGVIELAMIGVLALIIFGRRLPDVARSLGRSIVEFKKGLRDVESDVEQASSAPPPKQLPPTPAAPPAGTQAAGTQPSDKPA